MVVATKPAELRDKQKFGRFLIFHLAQKRYFCTIMSHNGITQSDSHAIARLRLPLAIGVVFIHLNMGVSGKDICWTHPGSMDFYRLFECLWTNELAALAVPLFFMISGLLFFRNGTLDYGHKLMRRVRSLLVPYVLFILLAIIGLVGLRMAQGHGLGDALQTYLGNGRWLRAFWDYHTTGSTTNILGWTKATAYPINIPLWFMRDLMVLVVASPIVYHAIRRLGWVWLVLMAAFTLSGIWIPLPGFGVTSCLFFSIGAWFGIKGVSPVACLKRGRSWLVTIGAVLMVADVVSDGTSIDGHLHVAFLVVGILAVYSLAGAVAYRPHGWEAQASFFVFATHALPLIVVGVRPIEWAKNLVWTNSSNGWVCCAQFLLAGMLTVLLCIAAFLLLRLVWPQAIDFATGRKPHGAKH